MSLRMQFSSKIESLRFELARLNKKLLDIKNTNSLKKFRQLRRKGNANDENIDDDFDVQTKIKAAQIELETWETVFQAEEKQLETLNISGRMLTELPKGIFSLINLRTLYLRENQLTKLPPEIGNLSKLEILDLSRNNLTTLPKEICQLTKLNYLNLQHNKFTEIPSQIFCLVSLKNLSLINNYITEIPKAIGTLVNLERLDIGNDLDYIPDQGWVIHGHNKIRVLPEEMLTLSNLKALGLLGNELTEFPIGLARMTELEILSLEFNFIKLLPSEIEHLPNLRHLNLRANRLSVLPRELLSLKQLEDLNLHDNELSIPPEILDKTREPQIILNYYFSVTKKGRKPINEIKLLIVGQGSVGKTSLVQQILHGTFDQNQNKTDGISINQWTIDDGRQTTAKDTSPIVNGQSSIKLNIWDFGGQEIMHATHQFFLTKRSLYLLVIDARLTQEENRVEYWLKIIQSFGGESPVLIVGNKTDQHPLDIDRTGLSKKYPNIVGILETSAATGGGIEVLKAELAKQVDTLPHVRDLLPETWFTVKSKLEELSKNKNFFTQDEYLDLCDSNNVADETSKHTLIGFSHDLGVVLHFQDDPRLEALGILNPQWVTNGVYKILDQSEYPSTKRLFVVDMMKKFELCYDIETDKSFLVPDLLPKDQPESIELKNVPAFQYQYPVLPSSVITRFIVRMNKYIENNIVWRTGVMLRIGNNNTVIFADIEDKIISIYIDGLEHTRRDALAAIRYQLDEIHDTIKGLNPQKRVPIPEAPNAEPLEYDYLLQLERDGYDEFPVKDGNRLVKIDVRKLLSGIESEVKRKESLGNVTNIYVGGDVSGNIIAGDDNEASINVSKFKRSAQDKK